MSPAGRPKTTPARIDLSVIIPVWNDAPALEECLCRLRDCEGVEVIVADASGDDSCAEVAGQFGARLVKCPTPGRGGQLNAGAGEATGKWLVFNHCDTVLTPVHLDAIRALGQDVRAGAFFRDLEGHYPGLGWLTGLSRWWGEQFGVVYGDQTMFFVREYFHEFGGFRPLPLMEDVELSDRLRRHFAWTLIDPPIRTSMRRFHRRGLWKNRFENLVLISLFRLGLSPERLYRWYYQKSARN